ncbi:Ig-like domain-containing protein [Paraflavitalea speifideaquila]|uniref:Ig-like domain-containing protein n=1 Tax=Paraflavitalea speifideaquila TaxID=3076558 RepID=UPI0028EE16A4|nr:Ig-like domain-containing protein [Paraflavitalea speifideiaquila]
MKRNFTLLVSAWVLLLSFGAQAQVNEKFNSRPGITLNQVKGHLLQNCWVINGFNTNDGWTPGIEGDGAMVSSSTSAPTLSNIGIYTQVLDIPGEVTVSFRYKLETALPAGATRWIKIYLTTPDLINAGPAMHTITLNSSTAAGTEFTFSQKFSPVGSGPYRVFLNYGGSNSNTRLGIDSLVIDAPLYYPTGCNSAPVAVEDNYMGADNRTYSGDVTTNDSDPEHESFDAYLTEQSPNGTVALNTDGTFTFTPHAGWAGNKTTFKYKICDFGYFPLCSEDVTVTINFAPSSTLPVSLVDFKGLYKDEGNVELSWVTNFEQNSDRFEIERSLDGLKWEVAGTIKTGANSNTKKTYDFIDKVGRNTVNKKDIYYRLKQVDLDGRASRSKILIVRVYNTRSLKMVSVSPNPAKNDIAVNVQLNEDSYIVMKVLNSNGAEVLRKSAKAGAGSNSYLMDGSSNLKPGMYVLEVTINSKERMIVKLIKE